MPGRSVHQRPAVHARGSDSLTAEDPAKRRIMCSCGRLKIQKTYSFILKSGGTRTNTVDLCVMCDLTPEPPKGKPQ